MAGVLTGPVSFRDGIETSNCLTTGVVFNKRNVARNIDLGLLFSHFLFFGSDWLGAVTTAVMHDILHIPEERWMAMKVYFSVIWLIPFRIKQEVLCVQKFLDLFGVEFLSIRNGLSGLV